MITISKKGISCMSFFKTIFLFYSLLRSQALCIFRLMKAQSVNLAEQTS